MNEKVAKVLRGYIKLTPYEQEEFVREINVYIQGDYYKKRDVETLVEKDSRSSSLGPKNSVCDCCGR